MDCHKRKNEEMDSLTTKYRTDSLTPAELQDLREKINAASDADVEQVLHRAWMEEEIDGENVSDRRMELVKERIDRGIGRRMSRRFGFVRIAQMAAAVLLPLFMALSGYLLYENRQLAEEEMIVSTARGERASVTLPDGTVVALNAESRLSYYPKEFHHTERRIRFNGEGYFQVEKDEDLPFLIDAMGMQVKVLGTTFNLHARSGEQTAELVLEEGSVRMESSKSHKHVVLQPAQRAVLDQVTGRIHVYAEDDFERVTAWRQGDMVFRNIPFPDVVRAIEENYHMQVRFVETTCPTDRFTGTLPLANLNEVLDVIEVTYHVRSEISESEVRIYSR